MRESEVQAAFVAHLMERGWDVTTENADFTDVTAKRGSELILAEAKGHTTSPGLDVDTMYGQLLRRMRDDLADVRHALVMAETYLPMVERVMTPVRAKLDIDVWLVSDLGTVWLWKPTQP